MQTGKIVCFKVCILFCQLYNLCMVLKQIRVSSFLYIPVCPLNVNFAYSFRGISHLYHHNVRDGKRMATVQRVSYRIKSLKNRFEICFIDFGVEHLIVDGRINGR